MKLSKNKLRKMIISELLNEGSLTGGGFADYLVPDAIEDAITGQIKATKEDIKAYIKKEVSDYVLENASKMSLNAPYGTQTIVEEFLSAKSDEIGDCAAGLFIGNT